MGITIVIFIPIHMYIKRKKIKKQVEDLIAILSGNDMKHSKNKEQILDFIKEKSIKHICQIFNMNKTKLIKSLKTKSIYISDENSKFIEIAKKNSKDVYQLFILILLTHLDINS